MSVGPVFVVELTVEKDAELPLLEGNPDEAAESVLDVPREEAVSDPVSSVLCVGSKLVAVELIELENPVLGRTLLDGCVEEFVTLAVIGSTLEVSQVVAVSRIVKVIKTPSDTVVTVDDSVVVTGKVVCSAVLVPLVMVGELVRVTENDED